MLPGNYSLFGCQQTVLYKETLKEIGDTFDFCKDWIDQGALQKYQNNISYTTKFYKLYERLQNWIVEKKKCQAACEETSYSVSTSMYGKNDPNGRFYI